MSRMSLAHGCTSTVPSVCGPPPARRCATSSQGPIARTRGRPTLTSGSTFRMTRGSRSAPTPKPTEAAMSVRAGYLVHADCDGPRDQLDWNPEFSRRARGFPVYAAIRSLGRAGVADLVERCCAHARRFGEALAALPGVEVLNEIVLNQVLVRFLDQAGDHDAQTRAVIEAVQRDGTCWLSGTTWHGVAAMRISVSSWATTSDDVERSLASIERAAAERSPQPKLRQRRSVRGSRLSGVCNACVNRLRHTCFSFGTEVYVGRGMGRRTGTTTRDARALTSVHRWFSALITAIVAMLALGLAPGSAAAATARTPVVFFPGYGTTILQVSVHDQTTVKGCPASGMYQDGIPANLGTTFSQVCRDELITPRWSHNAKLPWPQRLSLPPGVRITIPNYGQTSSAPVYSGFYAALENAGYTAGRNLVVAGYNFLLTPDLGGFLPRTKRLIVQTWRRNGRRPVRLVGHSNGPLYAQYLLTHVSSAWKHKYIQGFTDIDGNLPGSGLLWGWVFTGAEVPSVFSYPTTIATARSSAHLWAMSPATWMSTSDPAVFKNREVVIADQATGRSYTPANTVALLHAAGLDSIKGMVEHYLGFVRFSDPQDFPDVDVNVEAGSGFRRMSGSRSRTSRGARSSTRRPPSTSPCPATTTRSTSPTTRSGSGARWIATGSVSTTTRASDISS